MKVQVLVVMNGDLIVAVFDTTYQAEAIKCANAFKGRTVSYCEIDVVVPEHCKVIYSNPN